jgi:hypothetical protein
MTNAEKRRKLEELRRRKLSMPRHANGDVEDIVLFNYLTQQIFATENTSCSDDYSSSSSSSSYDSGSSSSSYSDSSSSYSDSSSSSYDSGSSSSGGSDW